jgi:DUF438 domain-containing protein
MWGKHDEIRALFREADEAKTAGDRAKLRRAVNSLAGKASRMFFMERSSLKLCYAPTRTFFSMSIASSDGEV